ncbi:MAG: PDZ domain-containing protein, partial [Myxococcales bacterium]|nr:PDZ domain-containing protein [Myxococcales bacterium]
PEPYGTLHAMTRVSCGLCLFLLLGLSACAYPRRTTSLSATGQRGGSDAPADVWQLTLLSATLPPERAGGIPWDDDGAPDPVVRLYRDGELIYESKAVENSTTPEWNETLPKNVWLPKDGELRIEVWDRDGLNSDPMGQWRGRGLPATALPHADARITLDNDGILQFRISDPVAHRGTGITLYESRSDVLVVMEVLPRSPAARAGLEPGARIVAMGGRAISDMTPAEAASALSMASREQRALTIEDDNGKRREVTLDDGYVWLTL